MSVETVELDPFDARLARSAGGLLAEFNAAGVLAAADVHVAARLAELTGEASEPVILAAALAVRAPRLGHVHVDLAQIRETAAVESELGEDLAALPWPDPAEWVRAVGASPLATTGPEAEQAGTPAPLRLVQTRLYLDRYWAEEREVATQLLALAVEPAAGVIEPVLARGLKELFPGAGSHERQAQAAATAVRRRLSVIAGGPGTGKTTTVARVVALLLGQAAAAGTRPPLIALAAPTGKAAVRLEEAVHEEARTLAVTEEVRASLLGLGALTIHRLLGRRPGSSSRFRHGRDQRLPHDVVIVDETSMVSLSLMARLIEALRPGARLVLVGDPGQLASIEAGAVLGDIVGPAAWRPPTPATADGTAPAGRPPTPGPSAPLAGGIVVLERVHRYGGAIARLAEAVRRGDAGGTLEQLAAGAQEIVWLPVDPGADPDGAELATVAAEACASAGALVRAARAADGRGALAALGAFRLLCAHRRGPYGVTGWSLRVQSWLAATVAGFDPDLRWYAGRPLLVTENDYELGLFNGDTGVVVAAPAGEDGDSGGVIAEPPAARIVPGGGLAGELSAAFERGGEIVHYAPSRLGAVETVFAMTIHKSQGSQFETAAVILPEPGSRLLTRELLYTAVTRARRRLIVAGTEAAIRTAVDRPAARASGLRERLWGE